ncbi:putative F-box domain, FBD domain, leucine-rich repeat domain, L domain-containing protein [Rosa chinensis]|uniref:Putative F-box domain, FBD domain, leucine-rich repeat domain, L domain-containing protein n=2 Tax=Rosa chinensis TaxID=74649 RepID=A0A2P6Q9E4_ROSCH|nr:putative F-box domain, FBD domain, leucine-rich repeat domain, L domain-containing protein [Rosa chinensis]
MSFSDDYPFVFRQQIRSFRGEDRISQLPDAVLRHILSFVPTTKCVVRTCILSKRWKDIWASIPNLYFRDEEFSSSADFIAFVDRVLLHRGSSAIQKFHLHFNRYCAEDFSRVDSWISTAVRCNVVELVLSIGSGGQAMFELPLSLVTCKTLEVLRLMMSLFIINNVPTSGCFPSLKCFHLHFTDNYANYTAMRLFYFSVLEHFTIDGDPGPSLLDLNIFAPELKTLRIEFSSSNDMHKYYNIDIDAPDLEKLDLKVGSLSNFSLTDTKSLVEADIKLCFHPNEDYVQEDSVRRDTEFLAAISIVKYLSLSGSIYEACSVPAFDNLIKLRLVHFGGSHWWKTLMKLLERSPNLECLVIDHQIHPTRRQVEVEVIELDPEKEEEVIEHTGYEVSLIEVTKYTKVLNWIPPNSVPNCLLSHLKTISIRGFRGKGCNGYLDEMELTKYLLKNGRVLEKMIIYTPGAFRDTKEDIFNETSMIEWSSKVVQVEIIEKMFYGE